MKTDTPALSQIRAEIERLDGDSRYTPEYRMIKKGEMLASLLSIADMLDAEVVALRRALDHSLGETKKLETDNEKLTKQRDAATDFITFEARHLEGSGANKTASRYRAALRSIAQMEEGI